MSSRTDKRQNKKRRKWPYWVGGIILALLLSVGAFGFYMYNQLGDTVSTMHDPLERDNNPERQQEIDSLFNDNDAVNVLLMGVDQDDALEGRSDTMILMSLNPKTDAMTMLSIPRDTYVNIPGQGMDKINHAYAFGGVELSVQTVEDAFDLPVHFYASVNMDGFEQGIDAIGGVTVHNTQAFSQSGSTFPEGEVQLNGEQALDYIRMRKEDPRGDIGRNERQRDVVAAAIDEAASFSSITKVGDILGILGGNVKTDMDMSQMQSLFSHYRGVVDNVHTIELDGSGIIIDGIWYYEVPDSEFNRVTNEIREHMEAG
ncbi:LCP family protein required for cell wall assembly [Virgibacillus natechei]|uniref:Polyisoprenyl-teichoic acid--peptidoglycan teichoic acid transferase TagU n=1 Tax=Virgibacillus natechei TaxID=1216297 RepID=A0ABS4IJQ0_9BACI|nr:LCP family protein [Virgibacillus natechei]MBP1971192.1 LCP family protein required for cell wall assembly [Virgibacillus natechei]UZD11939.1 LCP family protein [Virgibacillus natechei]